ncbi:MAG: carbohydrate kinase [Bacteroidetes bacterium]|nr:carbohydrate kinase [Bacteroidota bacterium]
MSRIYAIGETIYDIIFKNDKPVTAKAGGSMLNTAVSLGRLGLPISFISEYATDHAGNIIDEFLANNGVDTSYNYRYDEGKTPISLAFLNEQNDARYSFYKLYPEKRLAIALPEFKTGDIVLFGAFYSLMPEIRRQLISFVTAASAAGAIIMYDPNMRSPHKDEIESLKEFIYENLSLADIVRGSDEDFNTIFNLDKGADAYDILGKYDCNHLIYTKSNIGVEIYSPGGIAMAEIPDVNVVSTIGAGDSFNAGVIYELFISGEKLQDISSEGLEKIVKTAIKFGSHVCTHYDNYISEDFAASILSTQHPKSEL